MVLVEAFVNLYHSGFYHRRGKPGDINVHAGDVYLSYAQAVAQAEPEKGYFTTAPVRFYMEAQPVANPDGSIPTPLSESRRALVLNNRINDAEFAVAQAVEDAVGGQPLDHSGRKVPAILSKAYKPAHGDYPGRTISTGWPGDPREAGDNAWLS